MNDGRCTEDPLETLVHLSEVHFPGRKILNEDENVVCSCAMYNVLDKPNWLTSLNHIRHQVWTEFIQFLSKKSFESSVICYVICWKPVY